MNEAMVYQTLLWIGALGVGAMGVLGAAAHGTHAHGDHGSHGGHHGMDHAHGGHHAADVGHTSGAAHHGHAAHTTHGNTAQHGHHDAAGGHHSHQGEHHTGDQAGGSAAPLLAVMSWLSPMTLFSVSLGAGATGLLLEQRLPTLTTALFAVLAGIALFLLIVRPFTNFVQRFASKPAQTLEGTLAKEAIAQNRFDGQGRGIVSVIIDGQIVRLLAHLEREDQQKGTAVAPGDSLIVTQIDATNNTCHVTKL